MLSLGARERGGYPGVDGHVRRGYQGNTAVTASI